MDKDEWVGGNRGRFFLNVTVHTECCNVRPVCSPLSRRTREVVYEGAYPEKRDLISSGCHGECNKSVFRVCFVFLYAGVIPVCFYESLLCACWHLLREKKTALLTIQTKNLL